MKQRILGYRTPPCHRRPVIATQSSISSSYFIELGGSIMVGHRYWMPPPRQFQPMFQVLSTINCYATSSR